MTLSHDSLSLMLHGTNYYRTLTIACELGMPCEWHTFSASHRAVGRRCCKTFLATMLRTEWGRGGELPPCKAKHWRSGMRTDRGMPLHRVPAFSIWPIKVATISVSLWKRMRSYSALAVAQQRPPRCYTACYLLQTMGRCITSWYIRERQGGTVQGMARHTWLPGVDPGDRDVHI